LPLKIAGNVSKEPGGRAYFEAQVKPQLDDGVEWVGELDDRQKIPFLGNALALLFPIQWDEPFAVVVGEALACGTPIIALRRASTPEAIRHGRTGFLCDTPQEMVVAVRHVQEIDRAHCREFAEKTLAADVMADEYLKIYEETIRRC
jgi:glycosyltransferase involved in cell wall biosynthesis